MTRRVVITRTAFQMLSGISDGRIRDKIADVIDRLAHDPEKQGKPLLGELIGLRSVRAVGQRYRIIYAIKDEEVVVVVIAVGIRKEGADIYTLAKKLCRLKLLDKDS